jgi:histidine triad (HIT) family protein
MKMSIFKKIIEKKIPAEIIFEDEFCLAFRDINPQAPVHVLLIPKKEITSLIATEPSDHTLMGHLLIKAAAVAKQEGLEEDGYRVVINAGAHGGQTVDHLHLHILGGRHMHWPPG